MLSLEALNHFRSHSNPKGVRYPCVNQPHAVCLALLPSAPAAWRAAPLHLHALFTLKPNDGTATALLLISSALLLRAGRGNALVSSAVLPSTK